MVYVCSWFSWQDKELCGGTSYNSALVDSVNISLSASHCVLCPFLTLPNRSFILTRALCKQIYIDIQGAAWNQIMLLIKTTAVDMGMICIN